MYYCKVKLTKTIEKLNEYHNIYIDIEDEEDFDRMIMLHLIEVQDMLIRYYEDLFDVDDLVRLDEIIKNFSIDIDF